MNRKHKTALTLFITLSLGLIIGIAAIIMRYFDLGVAKIVFFIAVGVAGSGGIISIVCIKKDKDKVTSDERERLIDNNAGLAGFGAVYLLVILVSFLPVAIAPEAKIPTKWFPFLLLLAVFCQVYAMSISTLIQYRRGGKDGQ